MVILYLISQLIEMPNMYYSIYIMLYLEFTYIFILAQWHLKRKKYFWIRFAGCMLATIGCIIGSIALRSAFPDNMAIRWLLTLFNYFSYLGYFFLCYDERPSDLLLTWCTFLICREIADIAYSLLSYMVGSNPRTTLTWFETWPLMINYLIHDGIMYGIEFLLLHLFNRRDETEKDTQHLRSVLVISIIITIFTIGIKSVLLQYSSESQALYIAGIISLLALDVFVLFMKKRILMNNLNRQEKRVIEEVLANEKKQYETLTENITNINIKCHDIRHQLENLEGKLTSKEIEDLQSVLAEYNSVFKTGNEVIDTILYEKNLKCRNEHITLTCNGDASKLAFIGSAHLYSLFNNMLSNAIEAVEKVDDPDKRVIGVSVSEENQLVHLEVYNYFAGTFDKEHQETTKTKEKGQHGLGLKSIRYITELYHGSTEININADMFFLNVSLPFPSEAPSADGDSNVKSEA